eukprot:8125064-Pyramimonas_sp.AAC.1
MGAYRDAPPPSERAFSFSFSRRRSEKGRRAMLVVDGVSKSTLPSSPENEPVRTTVAALARATALESTKTGPRAGRFLRE